MKFANEYDIYVPKARKIENAKVGDKIKARISIQNYHEMTKTETKEYTITNVYPYHVRAVDADGCYKCFCLGELVKIGVEDSGDRGETKSPILNTDYD